MQENNALKLLITIPQEHIAAFYAGGLVAVLPHCEVKTVQARAPRPNDAPLSLTAQANKPSKFIKFHCHCGWINQYEIERKNGTYTVVCNKCGEMHSFYDYELARLEYECECGEKVVEYMPSTKDFRVFDYDFCKQCGAKIYLRYKAEHGAYCN